MKFIRALIAVGLVFAAGVVLTVLSTIDLIRLSKPKLDIAEIGVNDFYDKQYVTGDITELWGQFAVEEISSKSGNTRTIHGTNYYYAMPVPSTLNDDNTKYIAVLISDADDHKTAKKMAKEADKWYSDNIPLSTTLKGDGQIEKMSDDAYKLLAKYIKKEGGEESDIIRYVLHIGNSGGGVKTIFIVGIVLDVIGGALLALLIILKLNGKIR